jgi:hypothetical protein
MSEPENFQPIKWTTQVSDGTVVCEECHRVIPSGEEVEVRDGRPMYQFDPAYFHVGDCPPEKVQ